MKMFSTAPNFFLKMICHRLRSWRLKSCRDLYPFLFFQYPFLPLLFASTPPYPLKLPFTAEDGRPARARPAALYLLATSPVHLLYQCIDTRKNAYLV